MLIRGWCFDWKNNFLEAKHLPIVLPKPTRSNNVLFWLEYQIKGTKRARGLVLLNRPFPPHSLGYGPTPRWPTYPTYKEAKSKMTRKFLKLGQSWNKRLIRKNIVQKSKYPSTPKLTVNLTQRYLWTVCPPWLTPINIILWELCFTLFRSAALLFATERNWFSNFSRVLQTSLCLI